MRLVPDRKRRSDELIARMKRAKDLADRGQWAPAAKAWSSVVDGGRKWWGSDPPREEFLAYALTNLAEAEARDEATKRAFRHFSEAATLRESVGQLDRAAYAREAATRNALEAGLMRDAARQARDGLRLVRRLGDAGAHIRLTALLARSFLQRGDTVNARRALTDRPTADSTASDDVILAEAEALQQQLALAIEEKDRNAATSIAAALRRLPEQLTERDGEFESQVRRALASMLPDSAWPEETHA